MLNIIEIKTEQEKNILKNFLKENNGSILQDLIWGEFQRSTKKKVWNFAIIEDKKILVSAQVIKHELPLRKCYFYCPRGPVIEKFLFVEENKIKKILKLFIDYLNILRKKEGRAIFLRIEPEFLANDEKKIKILKDLGFVKSQKEIQPKDTLILDLSKTKEELLKEMHQKTRYNIRLAEKRKVRVKEGRSQKDFESFYQLLKKTAKRGGFFLHSKEYYQKQLAILGKKDYIKLFLAEYQDRVVAAILVLFYNKISIYLHGASDFEFRNLMAPHFLQWWAILEAKRRGYKIYDFWGIAPSNFSYINHPWRGITRFKRGFGGKEINYIGGWDFLFNKFWYDGYNFINKIREIIKNIKIQNF